MYIKNVTFFKTTNGYCKIGSCKISDKYELYMKGSYDMIVFATNARLNSIKIEFIKAKNRVSKNKFNDTRERKFNYVCISASRVIRKNI